MTSQLEVLLVEDNPADAELTICALKQRNLTRGVATLCMGGGNGLAVAIERL